MNKIDGYSLRAELVNGTKEEISCGKELLTEDLVRAELKRGRIACKIKFKVTKKSVIATVVEVLDDTKTKRELNKCIKEFCIRYCTNQILCGSKYWA